MGLISRVSSRTYRDTTMLRLTSARNNIFKRGLIKFMQQDKHIPFSRRARLDNVNPYSNLFAERSSRNIRNALCIVAGVYIWTEVNDLYIIASHLSVGSTRDTNRMIY